MPINMTVRMNENEEEEDINKSISRVQKYHTRFTRLQPYHINPI